MAFVADNSTVSDASSVSAPIIPYSSKASSDDGISSSVGLVGVSSSFFASSSLVVPFWSSFSYSSSISAN